MPSPAIITLTPDFGLSDHFVGVMKGVILSIAPAARIVDITHEIPPFERVEGAFTIAEAYRWFPRGTVHVVVVDPGVGTRRRGVLVEAAGQKFVGPDNGVFSLVYRAEPKARVRHLTAARYWMPKLSATFHGRDVFAPVAAHLAAGVPAAKLGPRIEDYVRLGGGFETPSRTAKRVWTGGVLKVDRFGNLITNFRVDEFPGVRKHPFRAQVGMHEIAVLAETFEHIPPGEAAFVEGSSGYLEVCVNQGSAAQQLGCGTGTPVELTLWIAPEEDKSGGA